MDEDLDPVESLSEAEVKNLARRALDNRTKSRLRSQRQRERHRAAGRISISFYVQEDRADYIRQGVKKIVEMTDEQFAKHSAERSRLADIQTEE